MNPHPQQPRRGSSFSLTQNPPGFSRAIIGHPGADAEVSLQGAHVLRFQPAGERPVLFLSSRSVFTPGKAVRGGIPIVFPWFGPKSDDPGAPMHGFARTAAWQFGGMQSRPDGAAVLEFQLAGTETAEKRWPHAFALRYEVCVGPILELALDVTNRSEQPFRFEEALHTYLSVGDIRQAAVRGLEGTEYLDKTRGYERLRQPNEPVRFSGETDRVYLDTDSTCILEDPVIGRRILIEKEGSATTVVWNPWIEKARALPDFGDDEWTSMVCIESGNAHDNAIELAPGSTHRMAVRLRTEAI